MKTVLFSILVLTIIISVSVPLSAKTLYVNNSGSPSCSDSTSYANNSASTPWCSVGRAAWGNASKTSANASQAAQAGDMVLVTAGTYSTSGPNSRFNPAYNPVNSGSSGNPITFEAVGTVKLTLSSSVGPTIGAYGKDYIVWKGFTINEANAISTSDTGPVVFWSSHNSQVLNCIITGRGNIARGDNYNGIRIEDSQYITVKNNRISNFGPTEGHNSACIMTYTSGGLLVENNDIYGCGSAVFLKANTWPAYPDGNGHRTWNTIRNNYIHDAPGGVNIHRSHETDQLQKVTQNIFYNITGDEGAVKLFVFGDVESDPNNVKVVNNTIVDSLYAFNVGNTITSPSNNIFWNNIVYKSSSAGSVVRMSWADNTYNGINPGKADFKHNLYYNSPYQLTGESVSSLSIATWKATYGQDSSSPAASTSDPLFVSLATGNYKLQASSPARALGVDILDLNNNGQTNDLIPAGAYITGNEVIGHTSGESTTLEPPPGLRRIN
jgi:hypothetical protein